MIRKGFVRVARVCVLDNRRHQVIIQRFLVATGIRVAIHGVVDGRGRGERVLGGIVSDRERGCDRAPG